jgi:hypothetical protein
MEPIPAASFGKSHISLIAVSIVLLVAASFMRGGLKLGSFGFSSAKSAPKPLTYEEIKAMAHDKVAQNNAAAADSSASDAQTQAQLAEVDPTYGTGSVLGASIGPASDADVDQVMNSGLISSLPISTYQTTDALQFNAYASAVHAVENKYGGEALIGALTTRDQASLQSATSSYKNIITGLMAVKVPTQFLEYHRMKLVYYSSLAQIASSMSGDGNNDTAASAASLFFSMNDKILALQSRLESQYEVIL